MNKITLTLASVMLGFSLSACGSEPTPEPEPETTMDDNFVDVVRDDAPYFRESASDDIVGLGNAVCESFDAGITFEQVSVTLIESGASGHDAGVFTAMAVAYLCPDHMDDLP